MHGKAGVENLSQDGLLWDVDSLRCAAAAGQSQASGLKTAIAKSGRAGERLKPAPDKRSRVSPH
jgi:hypothetical protein